MDVLKIDISGYSDIHKIVCQYDNISKALYFHHFHHTCIHVIQF